VDEWGGASRLLARRRRREPRGEAGAGAPERTAGRRERGRDGELREPPARIDARPPARAAERVTADGERRPEPGRLRLGVKGPAHRLRDHQVADPIPSGVGGRLVGV